MLSLDKKRVFAMVYCPLKSSFACNFLASAVFCVCFFSKLTFLKNYFMIYHFCVNSLDPDQDQHFVGPDLGPNCLQSLSADDTSRQRVNPKNQKRRF